MSRLGLLALCLATFSACGGDDDSPAASDAGGGVDAGGDTDAASRPSGLFRLDSIDDTESPLGGLLVIDDTAGTATLTFGIRVGNTQTAGDGALTSYAFDEATNVLQLDETSFSAMWRPTATPTVLDLQSQDDGTEYLFHGYEHARSETLSLAGTVRLGPNGPKALPNARVAYVALVRGGTPEAPMFQLLPDAALDQAVDLDGALTATFTMARTEGALGVERISFGAAGVSIGLVVVYQDRDGAPGLGRLVVDGCTGKGTDCIYGVAPIVFAYRDGTSTELAASHYAHLLPGWSAAVPITDRRSDGALGLGSLDPMRAPVLELDVAQDPATVTLPALEF